MKNISLFLIKLYQSIPGPWHDNCRYYPSCSNYAYDAISKYGFFKGWFISIKRILRCNPFCGSGYDPVPNNLKKNKKAS